jgi:hypothetical protein
MFDKLKAALLSVGVPVYHATALKQDAPYIVWAEDGQGAALYADDHIVAQAISGTIDYFTKTEYDPNFQKIQDALSELDIDWELNDIGYRDDGRTSTSNDHLDVMRYTWFWEVII